MKINRRQLRRIIKESIPVDAESALGGEISQSAEYDELMLALYKLEKKSGIDAIEICELLARDVAEFKKYDDWE